MASHISLTKYMCFLLSLLTNVDVEKSGHCLFMVQGWQGLEVSKRYGNTTHLSGSWFSFQNYTLVPFFYVLWEAIFLYKPEKGKNKRGSEEREKE